MSIAEGLILVVFAAFVFMLTAICVSVGKQAEGAAKRAEQIKDEIETQIANFQKSLAIAQDRLEARAGLKFPPPNPDETDIKV